MYMKRDNADVLYGSEGLARCSGFVQSTRLLFNYFVRLSWIHMKLDCKSEQILNVVPSSLATDTGENQSAVTCNTDVIM